VTTMTRHPAVLTFGPMIVMARGVQLNARMAWARSPNAQTIAATERADREIDTLLDRLSAALKIGRPDGMPAPQPMG
jgi:hypothetical protein